MIEEVMRLALGNGLWATLFCLLFLYQLKDSRSREKRYTDTIESLTKNLGQVKTIKQDCNEILETVKTVKDDCQKIRQDSKEIRSDLKVIKSGLGATNEL